ncbi:MAG: metallophosphoesterase [Planctomycetota bacterium]
MDERDGNPRERQVHQPAVCLRFSLLALCLLSLIPQAFAEAFESKDCEFDPCVIRIGVLSDMHLWLTDNPRYAVYTDHFAQAIDQANAAELDLVLIPGDLTNSAKAEEYARYREMAAELKMPVLCVPGNHDTGNKVSSNKKRLVTEQRVGEYRSQLGEPWYVAEPLPGLRVVALDTSLLGSGLPSEAEQWAFLESVLAASGPSQPVRTVVLLHYPLYHDQPDEDAGYTNVDVEPRTRLLTLMERADVDLVLSGHLHDFRDVTADRGMRMITAPALSFGLPFGETPQAWMSLELRRCDGQIESLEQHVVSPPTLPRNKD